jgi:hypothetical protein
MISSSIIKFLSLLQPSISFLLQPSRYSTYILQRYGGVDPKDLCVAVACLFLMPEVAKELLIFYFAEDRCFLALEPSTFLARRILRRIVLFFSFARLPWSVVEENLRLFKSEVLKGCYETSCDTLQRPLSLTSIVSVVAVHDFVVDVHHNAVVLVLRSFVRYKLLLLL